jgi:hypothetical protein
MNDDAIAELLKLDVAKAGPVSIKRHDLLSKLLSALRLCWQG